MSGFKKGLLENLPKVKGKMVENAPLGATTWFGVGGPAEVLFKPADKEDLISFIKECPKNIPITVLGVTSNLIIRDGGIPGVVIRMGGAFNYLEMQGDSSIMAGASVLDSNLSNFAMENSVIGFEFLSGIPGTVGGALKMNAGAYGAETKDILQYAEVLFPDGSVKQMTVADMQMSYRHNGTAENAIFLGALFKGMQGDQEAIKARMLEIKTNREKSQPIREKTGGSTFANPEGYSTWKLVDEAGMRGFKIGGAQVSEKHTNFLINTGNATAADIERLGEEVRKRVYEKSGVSLRWEIKRIGIPLPHDEDIKKYM